MSENSCFFSAEPFVKNSNTRNIEIENKIILAVTPAMAKGRPLPNKNNSNKNNVKKNNNKFRLLYIYTMKTLLSHLKIFKHKIKY